VAPRSHQRTWDENDFLRLLSAGSTAKAEVCIFVPRICSGPFGSPANLHLTTFHVALIYVAMKHIAPPVDRELKKGSAELLILSLVEHRARHGYEISKLIEERSDGVLKFNVASFYPLLYRLEKRGWIAGRWVEKAGQRRRRYYRLTNEGKQILKTQRATWLDFVNAIHRITEAENA
jgi:PadR family transcriptional regulator, regulatory protein PadR